MSINKTVIITAENIQFSIPAPLWPLNFAHSSYD